MLRLRRQCPGAACSDPDPDYSATAAADLKSLDSDPRFSAACRSPSNVEKGALRRAVRAQDRELKDTPWRLVHGGRTEYMAADLDQSGPRVVVLVSFPRDGRYVAAMRAVNGAARTFTDLPVSGDRIPAAGRRALACMGVG